MASRVALVALLSLLHAHALEGDAQRDEVCVSESGCEADAEDELAMSLRQLRATARHEPEAAKATAPADVAPAGAAPADAAPKDDESDTPTDNASAVDDFDPGLPGGWGEAAAFADEAEREEEEAFSAPTKGGVLHTDAQWGRGSCRRYRCVPYFVRHHSCQCNGGCERYRSCCYDYYAKCHRHHHHAPAPAPHHHSHHGTVMTLYHQTSPSVGPLILASGFRPGTQGWCGGGIYFATSAAATNTKAIGPDSHKGYILEAKVDVGRVKYMPRTCDRSLNGGAVAAQGYDSVSFDPGDGQEFIVYSNSRILSVRHI